MPACPTPSNMPPPHRYRGETDSVSQGPLIRVLVMVWRRAGAHDQTHNSPTALPQKVSAHTLTAKHHSESCKAVVSTAQTEYVTEHRSKLGALQLLLLILNGTRLRSCMP